MRYGSLFTGIGGFDLGFERAGMECAWQVEIDKDCQRVLKRRWPNVQRFDDVTTVRQFEPVDLICGGFPCQDLSVAGKRAGLAGERSGLWFEFLRIIESNLPRWIVIENVPGLLSSDEGRDLAIILRGLANVGYCLAWRVLDAQYFGVAQRRRRVFIVGSLGTGSSAEVLFESESVSGNPPSRSKAGERVAHAVTTGTGKSSGPRNGNGEPLHLISLPIKSGNKHDESHQTYVPDIAWALQERDAKGADSDTKDGHLLVTHSLRSEGADVSEDGTGRGTPIVIAATLNSGGFRTEPGEHLVAFSSKDHGADAGSIAPTLRSQNFKDSHMNGGGQVAVAFTSRGRAEGAEIETQSDLAYALRDQSAGGGQQSRIGGAFGVRRLTPRECERLQSFPDDFSRWDADGKEISDSARYRMLGNAVPVNVSEWIGKRIVSSGWPLDRK